MPAQFLFFFLSLCVDNVPGEAIQLPLYHLSLKLPYGDLNKRCWYLTVHFSLPVSHSFGSFSLIIWYLKHYRQRRNWLTAEGHAMNCRCLFLSYTVCLFKPSHRFWVLLICVCLLRLLISVCLFFRTVPSKSLSQWGHLWNQWNIQGGHIHWICLQVPTRLQWNPLPTQ